MLYKFDPKSLTYKKVISKTSILILTIVLTLSTVASLITISQAPKINYINEETRAIVLTQEDAFSLDKLKAYILQLNIKYPYIVLAQAEIESGNFTSQLFKENHNLFGFKVANQRPTTNLGQQYGFAYYHCWKESVEDYALYSAAYLNNIKTPEQYYSYLAQYYDNQDTNYVSIIKNKVKEIEKNQP